MSTSSTTAVSFRQQGQLGEQVPAGPFSVDPVKQLRDLVLVEVTPAGQPLDLVLLLTVRLAVRGIHAPRDAEHPGPRGALPPIKGTEAGDRRHEGIGGQVSDDLRVVAAPSSARPHRQQDRPRARTRAGRSEVPHKRARRTPIPEYPGGMPDGVDTQSCETIRATRGMPVMGWTAEAVPPRLE